MNGKIRYIEANELNRQTNGTLNESVFLTNYYN